MTRLLASPRRRRRLALVTSLLVVAGSLAFVGIRYSNTGKKLPNRFYAGKVQLVPPALKAAQLSGDDRDAARQVAARFIDTAVLRQRIDDSWEITAPKLRQGLTREQWHTGNIPVQPFPAAAVLGIKYRVDWSGADYVYLKVAIIPKATADVGGQSYDMGLRRTGPATDHHWLVDYWVPSGLGQATPKEQAAAAKLPLPELKSRINPAWIFAPIAIFAAFFAGIPLFLFFRGWSRTKRANRLYRAS